MQGFSFCLHCGQGLEASKSNEQLPAGVIDSDDNLVLNKSRLAASSSPLQLGRCFYLGRVVSRFVNREMPRALQGTLTAANCSAIGDGGQGQSRGLGG